MSYQSAGYTLVEMLVAMAVSSVVLAGTYAAYSFFAQQQQLLLGQTELSRNAMQAVDQIQTDIRHAGFKDYYDDNVMSQNQPINIDQTNPADFRIVYDLTDNACASNRILVRYYIKSVLQRDRLMRQVSCCNDAATFCDVNQSTVKSDEPLLDWVTQFTVKGLHPKISGSFKDQYQTLEVSLSLKKAHRVEGMSKDTEKTFTFIGRAKNVSLVP